MDQLGFTTEKVDLDPLLLNGELAVAGLRCWLVNGDRIAVPLKKEYGCCMAAKRRPIIAVLGSLNIDLVASMANLPKVGETVAATGLQRFFGGKGANQAVATVRQGADVRMIGRVGGDADGRAYKRRLREEGINVAGVQIQRGKLTGAALIGVDTQAENLIMVAPEANGSVNELYVRSHRRLIESADRLLIQFEVPIAAVVDAVQVANEADVSVTLNPSPYADFPWGDVRVDTLVMNESEAQRWGGDRSVNLIRRQVKRWVADMKCRQVSQLVITRGSRSTLAVTLDHQVIEMRPKKVSTVDTVGAGDAFAGALSVALAKKATLKSALEWANAAGSLATLRSGAQEAMPTRSMVRRLLKSNSQALLIK